MSIALMTVAFQVPLPPSEKLMLLALCDEANDSGEQCYPSDERLATKASVSTKTIARTRTKLIKHGLIEVEWSGGRGSHHYQIKVDNLTTFASRKVDIEAPKGGQALSTDPYPEISSSLRSEERTPGGVRELVAFYFDEGGRLGSHPPQSDAPLVAKMAKQMLDEGVPSGLAHGAITVCLSKGLRPSAIPGCVPEAKANNVRPRKERPHWDEEPYDPLLPRDQLVERAKQLSARLVAASTADGPPPPETSPAEPTQTSSDETPTMPSGSDERSAA